MRTSIQKNSNDVGIGLVYYLCSVPDSAGQWYQLNDQLLHLSSEATLITEETGCCCCKYLVEQLGVRRHAVYHGKVSLETTWNIVPAATRASHCRYKLDKQATAR